MSRQAQDSVIDDDEETCPLCIEEFDLSDKNFRPCPCGYQICQFCFNSLKTTYEKSTCPNCRRPYDEKTIQYKIPTAEEFKQDQQNKNKKQLAARRKETEKREVEVSSRRNLAGVRVKQMNLVYVIGLIPTIKDETSLLNTLRGTDYFGQYGDIEKIVVSKAKPTAANQGVGVYVTYARKEDAALCIQTVDGSMNGERVLRAQYGTTKYCSAFLRGETCNNKSCSFLHETGEDGQGSSLQNEANGKAPGKAPSSVQISGIPPPLRSLYSTTSTPQMLNSQPMVRQGSADENNSRKGSTDGSALPSSASWGNAQPQLSKTRRVSQNARATPSPKASAAVPSSRADEPRAKDFKPALSQTSTPATSKATASKSSSRVAQASLAESRAIFDRVMKNVTSPHFKFVFDDTMFTKEELEEMENYPSLIDPYGGAKHRLMLEKQEAERKQRDAAVEAQQQQQAQNTQSAIDDGAEDEQMGTGSLALGGEPEETPRAASVRGAIGKGPQASSNSFLNEQFSSLNMNTPTVIQQQRQQSGSSRAPGLSQHPNQTGFDSFDVERGPQLNQPQQDPMHGHQRQNSRYFPNDKSAASRGFQGQQQQPMYQSSVQGPPPGLPTAGTPPFSGGGMFAHGQGFTSNANSGFGAIKDSNVDGHHRGRSGTNDVSKRGGVEGLSDPSILQARLHHSGGASGQGLFGTNQVDESDFPSLPSTTDKIPRPLHSRVSSFHSSQGAIGRVFTPKIPPGFETSHAHPSPSSSRPQTPLVSNQPRPIKPVIPLIPNFQRVVTPHFESTDTMEVSKAQEPPAQKVQNQPDSDQQAGSDLSTSLSTNERTASSESMTAKMPEVVVMTDTLESKAGAIPSPKPSAEGTSRISIKPSIPLTKPAENIQITPTTLPTIPIGPRPKSETPPESSAVVPTTQITSLRPSTPVTAASETSKTTAKRPLTIRVTTNTVPKTAESVPASAVTEKSMSLPASAQGTAIPPAGPAASPSPSRPSTPAMSDHLSADLSRASSPPPSIVGAPPERMKSKAQQKKERKEKAKKINEASEPDTPATPVVEEVAPVVGRQRKQKKTKAPAPKPKPATVKEQTTQETTETPKFERKISKDIESLDVEPTKKKIDPKTQARKTRASSPSTKKTPMVEPTPEVPQVRHTVRDLFDETARRLKVDPIMNESTVILQVLDEYIPPLKTTFGDMFKSGDLDRNSALFSPTPLNSSTFRLPPDSRNLKGADYLAANGYTESNPFGTMYLGNKEKHALLRGQDVSVSDETHPDDLLRRALVTGWGTIYRHLSAEEEEKVVNLEEKREAWHAEMGDRLGIGLMNRLEKLEESDYNNIEGDVGDLVRAGEKYGIGWVKNAVGRWEEDEDDDEEEEEDDDDDDDEEDEEGDIEELGDDEEDVYGEELELARAAAAAAAAGADDDTDDLGVGEAENNWNLSKTTVVTANATPADLTRKPNAHATATTKHPTSSISAATASGTPFRYVGQAELRAMTSEQLEVRAKDALKEMDLAKKEMDRIEKLLKAKDKEVKKFWERIGV